MFSTFIHLGARIRILLFLWLNNILLFVYVWLSILLLIDTWVVSSFWLVWIYFSEYWHLSSCLSPCFLFFLSPCFQILECISLGVELLGCVVILCLCSWGTAMLSSTVPVPFYIPTGDAQRFQLLRLFTYTCCFLFLILAILMYMRWYLIMVFACIS